MVDMHSIVFLQLSNQAGNSKIRSMIWEHQLIPNDVFLTVKGVIT